jgi:hypothetical protein
MMKRTLVRILPTHQADTYFDVIILARRKSGNRVPVRKDAIAVGPRGRLGPDFFAWVETDNIDAEDVQDISFNHDTWAPVTNLNAHSTHCCTDHGCKYSDPDCPIEHGDERQLFPCESCTVSDHPSGHVQKEIEFYVRQREGQPLHPEEERPSESEPRPPRRDPHLIRVRFDIGHPASTGDEDRGLGYFDLPQVPDVGDPININGNPYIIHRRGWVIGTEGDDAGRLFAFVRVGKAGEFKV